MANEDLIAEWPVEEIPGFDYLFKRVHQKLFKPDGTIMTGAFRDREMSVDWSKYSTPEETHRREGNPEINAVVQMRAGDVRDVPGLSVVHAPVTANRAHSHILGSKNEEARVKLRRGAFILLPLPA